MRQSSVSRLLRFEPAESDLLVARFSADRRNGGVCFTGRDKNGDSISRLGLSEAAIDELTLAIAAINKTTIHQKSQDTLGGLTNTPAISASLPVPDFGKKGFTTLMCDAKDAQGKKIQQVIGLIARNLTADTESLKGDDQKNGALVLGRTRSSMI
jgi:hypothetical protein